MAIKLADVIENANSDYPVIDASNSGSSGIKGFGIFSSFGNSAGERGALPSNKQCTGYIAVNTSNGAVEVYKGGGWTTASNWVPVLNIPNLPDPDLTTDTYEYEAVAEMLLFGNAAGAFDLDTEQSAYFVAHTTYQNQDQQFKVRFNDIAAGMVYQIMNQNIDAGLASGLTVYTGGTGIPGDFNGNGFVDTSDLIYFLSVFENSAATSPFPQTPKLTYFFPPLGAQESLVSYNSSAGETYIDLKETEGYTPNTKWYLPFYDNVVGGSPITYYSVQAGSATVSVNDTGTGGTDYFQFGDNSGYEIATLFGSAGNTAHALAVSALSVGGALIYDNEGPDADTITFGYEITFLDANGSVLVDDESETAQMDIMHYRNTFAANASYNLGLPLYAHGFTPNGGFSLGAGSGSGLVAEENNYIQANLVTNGYPQYGFIIPATEDDSTNSSAIYPDNTLPFTAIRVKPYFKSQNGTTTITIAGQAALVFQITY